MQYEKGSKVRKAEYPIDKMFLDRWSPRAMSAEEIDDEELMALFEAAKWAPSNNNEQPWRFVYAKRDTKYWDKFFGFLIDFNKMWCKNASALVVLLAKKNFSDGKPNRNAMSDSGAAWENLALQGLLMGLVVHGMAGYDLEKARKELDLSDEYEIVHMIAIGKPADKSVLHERMQKSEMPNSRKPLKDIVFEGKLGD